jgi:single-strand DNA-binding protein
MSMNKVILMGRLTADPELKQTQSGTSVVSFSIAVDRRFNKDEQKKADFINCVAWRTTAEFVAKYFSKGSQILLVGELQTRTWEDQNGQKRYVTEVIASEVSFCGSKNSSGGNSYAAEEHTPAPAFSAPAPAPNFEEVSGDEDLPF